MYKYSSTNPLVQYFMEPPLAAITATGLLGYVSICFAHLDPNVFAHSSCQNCSSTVRLDGGPLVNWKFQVLLHILNRIGVGFSWVIPCLGFLLGLPCIWHHQSFPQHWQALQSLCMKSIPSAGCYHHQASRWRWMNSIVQTSLSPESSMLVSSDHQSFFHMFPESPSRMSCLFLFFSLHKRLSFCSASWSIRAMIVLWTASTIWPMDFSSSFRVSLGNIIGYFV